MEYVAIWFWGSLLDTWAVFKNNPVQSTIATIILVCFSLLFSAKRGKAAVKANLVAVWNGAKLPLAGLVTVFGLNLLLFTPKRLYEEQKAMADTVPQLKAEIEYRKNNLDVTGPAFGNIMDTLNVFRTYRGKIGPNAECQIKITSPDQHSNIAVTIRSLANVGANCQVFGPSDTSIDPDLQEATVRGMVAGKIVFHAAKDALGATELYLLFSNYIPLTRSYDIPPGAPVNFIWLQFGPDVKWNTELTR